MKKSTSVIDLWRKKCDRALRTPWRFLYKREKWGLAVALYETRNAQSVMEALLILTHEISSSCLTSHNATGLILSLAWLEKEVEHKRKLT